MPASPSKDLESYRDLITRMAAVLRIQISQPPPTVPDNVYDMVQREVLTAIALPIPGVLLQHTKELWVKVASTPVSRRLSHMYQVQQEGVEFLFAHLKPNSVVVSLASKSRKRHSTRDDRERKLIQQAGSFILLVPWELKP